MCQRFYLFEPIMTAILVSTCSAVHLVRIRAIYDKSNTITGLLGGLLCLQVALMAVACGFYHGRWSLSVGCTCARSSAFS